MRMISTVFLTLFMFGCCAAGTEGKSTAVDKQNTAPPAASCKGVISLVMWTVSRYVITPHAQWQEEDARQLLFKPLHIDKESITFDKSTCRDVIFDREKVNAKEYLESVYKTTPQALGIADETIEVVKTNCSLPGFESYLRLKYGRLAIFINGVFFFFEPALDY